VLTTHSRPPSQNGERRGGAHSSAVGFTGLTAFKCIKPALIVSVQHEVKVIQFSCCVRYKSFISSAFVFFSILRRNSHAVMNVIFMAYVDGWMDGFFMNMCVALLDKLDVHQFFMDNCNTYAHSWG
jgi:hypothetical protein